MQDFNKAFISTVIVFLVVIVLTAAILIVSSPYYVGNYDLQLRNKLAGTLDMLIIGASHGQCALYTRDIDNVLSSHSYNLSYDSLKNYEKNYLLKKEINRNDIKTVIFDLSYDTLQHGDKTDYTDSNIFTINRMDDLDDKLSFWLNYVKWDNKLFVLSDLVINGLYDIKNNLFNDTEEIDPKQIDLKGSRLLFNKDHSLKESEIISSFNKDDYNISTFNTKTVDDFTKMIKLCKDNNIRVIVAVVPVSDNYIWCTDNLDSFNTWAIDYCSNLGIEYYDFNLLKNRYSLFNDFDCYSTDTHHMSEIGARIFSPVFATIIDEAYKGKSVSEYFYGSYSELKQNSPYMEYLN